MKGVLWGPAAVCGTLLIATAATAGSATAVVGAGDEVRAALDLGFAGSGGDVAFAAEVAHRNGSLVAAVLVSALIAPCLTRAARTALLVVIAGVFTFNAALVGAAAAAYGARLLGAVALHLPLEWSAFSIACGACLRSVRAELCRAELVASAVLCGILVVAAAALEAYAASRGAS